MVHTYFRNKKQIKLRLFTNIFPFFMITLQQPRSFAEPHASVGIEGGRVQRRHLIMADIQPGPLCVLQQLKHPRWNVIHAGPGDGQVHVKTVLETLKCVHFNLFQRLAGHSQPSKFGKDPAEKLVGQD